MKFVKVLLVLFLIMGSLGAEEKKRKARILYKDSKRIDFEALLIEGELKRPEMLVTTGTIQGFGIMKSRDNFLDAMANDLGEKIK